MRVISIPITIQDFAPFIPEEHALERTDLLDKAHDLTRRAARLDGHLAPLTYETLCKHMEVINSYYSNLIEGNRTHPHEIREAQRGNYSEDPAKRDLQTESVAHITVQDWIRRHAPSTDEIFSADFICELHRRFYQAMPEHLRQVTDDQAGEVIQIIPGEYRARPVKVGRHVPPDHEALSRLITGLCDVYHPLRHRGSKKIVAAMCAHHRLAWVHPFIDGNGRVARLWTDAALKTVGLDSYGVWCLSRGLARTSGAYKAALAKADHPRQGAQDGRGQLTQQGLIEFCDYMLDRALDQVCFIEKLLDIKQLRKRISSYVKARNDHLVSALDSELKPQAVIILQSAFQQGELDRSDALELTGLPQRSARRLLSQLRDEGLLSETSTKSPLRWEIPEHAEPFYFPQLAPTAD